MSNLNKAWWRYLTLSWCLALSCLPFQQSDRGEGPRQHCGWQRCGEDESWTRSTKINSCLSCTYQLRNFWCHQSTFSVTTGQVWSVSLLTTSTIFQSNNFQGIIFVVTCVPDLDHDHLVVYFVSRVLMSTLMVEPRSFLRDCLLLLILDCFCNFPATVSVLQSLLIRIFMTPSKQKLFYFESTSHLPKYFKK